MKREAREEEKWEEECSLRRVSRSSRAIVRYTLAELYVPQHYNSQPSSRTLPWARVWREGFGRRVIATRSVYTKAPSGEW